MDKKTLEKIKALIKAVQKDKPQHFAFSAKVGIKGSSEKPEPLLLLDKQRAFEAGQFAQRAKGLYGLQLLPITGSIFCGTVRRGNDGLLFEVNPKASRQGLLTKPAEILLRKFGVAQKINLLQKAILKAGEISPLDEERASKEALVEPDIEVPEDPDPEPEQEQAPERVERVQEISPKVAKLRTLQDRLGKQVGQIAPVAKAWENFLYTALNDSGTALDKGDTKKAETTLRYLAEEVTAARAWIDAKKVWLAAELETSEQLKALKAALKKTNDPELVEIADSGIDFVGGRIWTPVIDAINAIEAGGGAGRLKAIRAAQSLLPKLEGILTRDETILACDENPFAVKVSLRETLSAAFDTLESALQGFPEPLA